MGVFFGEEDGGDSMEFVLICEIAVEVAFTHSNINLTVKMVKNRPSHLHNPRRRRPIPPVALYQGVSMVQQAIPPLAHRRQVRTCFTSPLPSYRAAPEEAS